MIFFGFEIFIRSKDSTENMLLAFKLPMNHVINEILKVQKETLLSIVTTFRLEPGV